LIRILHFADLHLGVETYGRPDPQTGLNTRFLDFLRVLDEVVAFALNSQVDLALFCGDAYKSRDPSQTQQREFAKRLARLSAAGIPTFLLVGNHDLPNAPGRATAVDIFDTLQVANITVANKAATYRIHTAKGPVQIVALPWPRRGVLLSAEETKNLSLEELDRELQRILADILAVCFRELDPALPTVLAAHISLAGAKWGSERPALLGREPLLLQGNLSHPHLDYTAMGHIHRHQIMGPEHSPIVYPGSLERLDFGEAQETKGFCVVELDPGRKAGQRLLKLDFHPVQARRFHSIEVRLSPEDAQPTATLLHTLEQHRQAIEDAVVRVQIHLHPHQSRELDDAEIRRGLRGAYFALPLALEVEHRPRARLSLASAQGRTPLETLQEYLVIKKTPATRAQKLLQYARRLMQPESEDRPAP